MTVLDEDGFAVDMRRMRCLHVQGRLGTDGEAFIVRDALYDDYTNTVMVRMCGGRVHESGTYYLRIGFTDGGGTAMDTGWFAAVTVDNTAPSCCDVVEVEAVLNPGGDVPGLAVLDLAGNLVIDGEAETVNMSDGMRKAFRRALGKETYTDAASLVSRGNAYIDTGLTLNGSYRFVIEGNTKEDGAGILFDAYTDNNARTGGILYNRQSPRYDRWWTGVGYGQLSTSGIDLSSRFTLEQNMNGVAILQGSVESRDYYGGSAVVSGSRVLLFASDRADLQATYTEIYSALIYGADGALLRDFRPVVRDSDGVPGMWEAVEGKFYANAGSGSFEIG